MKKPYKCDQCEKAFSEHSSLQTHKRTHSGEKPFRCKQCDKAFSEIGSLQKHNRIHSGEKPFRCNQCNKPFSQSSHLQRHERTHTGEKLYICDRCNKAFSQSAHLQRHTRTHTDEKLYQCDQCDKTFSSNSDLQRHKQRHTGETPYKCDQCDKAFPQKSELQIHKHKHTGERPYSCEHCSQQFSQSSNRCRHQKKHEVQQNYKFVCEMQDGGLKIAGIGDIQCSIRCKNERDLECHMQRHHTKEGIAQKFHSETKLAEFFESKNIRFHRDWMNRISFQDCKNIEGGKHSARPDFYLHDKSIELGCVFLVGNDEFAHRQTKCEFQRMFNITQALQQTDEFKDVPIVYVRFNPHFYRMNGKIYDLPLGKAHELLLEKINSIKKEHIKPGMNLMYVNYDMQDNKLCIFENDEHDDYSHLYRDALL